MIVFALLLVAQAIAPPPVDWAPLPMLRYRRAADVAPGAAGFVRDEATAGRCTAAVRGAGEWTLRVDLAVLGTATGQAREVVPRAIGCAAVEQYAAGLISRMARDNLVTDGTGEAWYRTSVTFTWPG